MKVQRLFKVFTFFVSWVLLCLPSQAAIKIDGIGEALDLSSLSAGSYEVVMRAAGNSASDKNYGFVYYTTEGNGQFKIDPTCSTRVDLTTKAEAGSYIFTLIKNADGSKPMRATNLAIN